MKSFRSFVPRLASLAVLTGLALPVHSATLFFSDDGTNTHSIESDGSNIQTLSLAIDSVTDQLYVGTFNGNIFKSNLDGSNLSNIDRNASSAIMDIELISEADTSVPNAPAWMLMSLGLLALRRSKR